MGWTYFIRKNKTIKLQKSKRTLDPSIHRRKGGKKTFHLTFPQHNLLNEPCAQRGVPRAESQKCCARGKTAMPNWGWVGKASPDRT